jgi:hypothetical protein
MPHGRLMARGRFVPWFMARLVSRFVSSDRLIPCHFVMPCRILARLRLGNGDGGIGFAAHGSARPTLHPLTNDFRYWLINGTGVGLLLANSELGQHVDDGMRRDFQLPCELIDSNFTHK